MAGSSRPSPASSASGSKYQISAFARKTSRPHCGERELQRQVRTGCRRWHGRRRVRAQREDGRPPTTLNDTTLICIPKNNGSADAGGARRLPGATRPLGLTHSDIKALSSLVARPITAAAAWQVPNTQRGFIPGRCAEQHILEVDVAARTAAVEHLNDDHVLLAFDTAAAFPPLARQAIDAMLRYHGLPEGMRTLQAGELRWRAQRGKRRLSEHALGYPSPLFVLTTLPLLLMLERTTPIWSCSARSRTISRRSSARRPPSAHSSASSRHESVPPA